MKTFVILSACIAAAVAQWEGLPRISVPGAYPSQQQQQRQANLQRQARIQHQVQQNPQQVARIRRPSYGRPAYKSVDLPRPSFQSLVEPPKPVTEEPEDELQEINTPGPIYTPSAVPYTTSSEESQGDFFDFISTTPQPKPQTQPIIQYQTSPSPIKIDTQRPVHFRPSPSFLPVLQPVRNEPAPLPRPQQPARVQQVSYRPQRPQHRPEPRPYDEEDEEPIQPVRQQYNKPQQEQKHTKPFKSTGLREKKPVAQVIRKYMEHNPDGSITWGYENDDGSFKEETMGVDCVTKGKYGYVDPDGVKREYSYETGNPCDKNKPESEEEEKGFVDYQENKAVLPNGVTIDLDHMGKKSKRPFRSPSNH